MTVGPGKYDDLATLVRERTEADAVAVIVLGGYKGSGFAVQTTSPQLTAALPTLLRRMADDIEADT